VIWQKSVSLRKGDNRLIKLARLFHHDEMGNGFPKADKLHLLSDEEQTLARKKLGGNFIARHARSA
jgi:hypothetical protein